jgi:dephospho-CoA kinase
MSDPTGAARVHRVALTGGIATGKTHVRVAFDRLDVPTIDSDTLARHAVAPGTPGLKAVVQRFGRDVLDVSGALDRRKLGDVVFADPEARKALEAIVHPEVRDATERWFASLDAAQHAYAVADIPLLYEVGRDSDFEAVIVVACDPAAQLRRLMDRDRLSEDDARRRIGAQMPIDEKARRADYVIRTDGTLEETERQVGTVFQRLNARWDRPR